MSNDDGYTLQEQVELRLREGRPNHWDKMLSCSTTYAQINSVLTFHHVGELSTIVDLRESKTASNDIWLGLLQANHDLFDAYHQERKEQILEAGLQNPLLRYGMSTNILWSDNEDFSAIIKDEPLFPQSDSMGTVLLSGVRELYGLKLRDYGKISAKGIQALK